MQHVHQGGWYGKDCTHGDEACLVFHVGKGKGKKKQVEVWAGSKNELKEKNGWALVISAVGYAEFLKNPISVNAEAKEIGLPTALFTFSPPPCIGIEWPDRGVPNLERQWWRTLADAIIRLEPGSKVGLCCLGGHGRTGTMLAILSVLFGVIKGKKCPVAWVRKNYCKEAVESRDQRDYIEYVTDVKVTAAPSDEKTMSYPTGPAGPAVNPTGRSVVPATVVVDLVGTTLGSTGGGTATVEVVSSHEPTDLELLHALDASEEGDVTALIEGCGSRRWSPIYGEEDDDEDEILGWCSVEPDVPGVIY